MRRLRIVGSIVVALAAGGALHVWRAVDRLLDRRHPGAGVAVAASTDAGAVARGAHLADVTGCTDCHGPDLRGRLFIDDGWWRGRYHASNLTLTAQGRSDAELARIVRDGVHPDGRGVVVMPSFGFVRLTDAELADLLAFVRSRPPGGAPQPGHWIGPLDRWAMFAGTLKPAIDDVAIERRKQPPDLGPAHERARHLAGIVCAECHGGDLKGHAAGFGAPDLAVAAAYGLLPFQRLLRTGVGADGRPRGLMSKVAKDRLHHLGDDEIAAIHAYLVARAKAPIQ